MLGISWDLNIEVGTLDDLSEDAGAHFPRSSFYNKSPLLSLSLRGVEVADICDKFPGW